jgi:hypothetical protein
MVTATTTGDLRSSIEDYRSGRIEKLGALLRKLPEPYFDAVASCEDPLLRWALANQLYRCAVTAARSGDAAELLAPWLPGQAELPTGLRTPFVVDRADARVVDIGAELPACWVDPTVLAEPTDSEGVAAVRASVEVLRGIGYGDVLDEALAIVVLQDKKVLGEQVNSWTTTALPSTIFVDWYDIPELLAKDVLHEATHAWLNDAIDARGVEFPAEELYYSPWKKCLRPAYGMLHSVAAFSRVTNYLARLYDETADAAVREYCVVRIEQEAERLSSVREAGEATFSVTPDREIADLVASEYEEAVAAPARLH